MRDPYRMPSVPNQPKRAPRASWWRRFAWSFTSGPKRLRSARARREGNHTGALVALVGVRPVQELWMEMASQSVGYRMAYYRLMALRVSARLSEHE